MKHIAPVVVLWGMVALLPAAAGAQGGAKAPVPDEAAVKKAEELILQVFGEQLKAAEKDDKAREDLFKALVENARDPMAEPPLRFRLFQKATELAARGGDVGPALSAVREFAAAFEIDEPAVRTGVFVLAQPAAAKTSLASRKLTSDILEFQGELFDLDRFDLAVKLAEVARLSSDKGEDDGLKVEVKKRTAEALALAKEYERVKKFADKLKSMPTDAEANLEVGKFLALLRGSWDRALPLLANGPAGAFQKLAKQEMLDPREAKDQLELAEGWRHEARPPVGPAEAQMLLRSAYWYQQALLRLTGPDKVAAEAKFKEVVAQLPAGYRLPGITAFVRELTGHGANVMGVALSRDGKTALTAGGKDETVRLWDLKTGKELFKLVGHTNWVRAVAISPDGTLGLSSGDDKTIRVWDLTNGKEVAKLQEHQNWVKCLAFLPDGNQFVSGGDDKMIYLWDLRQGKVVRSFQGHKNFVLSLAVSKDGRRLLSGGADGTVRLWDVDSASQLKHLEGHDKNVTAVALTPDGRFGVSAGYDGTARLWDLENGGEVRKFLGHKLEVYCLALTPDGRQLFTGGKDRTVRVWDVGTGREVRRLEGHSSPVVSLAVAANGRVALSGSVDRTARLWGESEK